MLTKQPDYTISELGCPQLCSDICYKKSRQHAPTFRRSPSLTPSPSPSRLLPLRETLDDYNQRLLSEQAAASCGATRQQQQQQYREWDDKVAQQKTQKNLWNEQQQQLQWNRVSNQKCRDIAQLKPSTLLNYDLNSF